MEITEGAETQRRGGNREEVSTDYADFTDWDGACHTVLNLRNLCNLRILPPLFLPLCSLWLIR